MTSHDLARELLNKPDSKIEASIDISTGENDAHHRLFSKQFLEFDYHGNELVVLYFEGIEDNNDTG